MGKEIKYTDFSDQTSVLNSFYRSDAIPLDKSNWFETLADAEKYAAGNEEDPDSRELCFLSYAGQVIAVKTGVDTNKNGIYKSYIIQGNGKLNEVGGITFKLSASGDLQYSQDGGNSWTNIQMPSGSIGLQGATGAQGATGPKGLNGATGAQGATGPKGVTGAQGATGPKGEKGKDGIDGNNGEQGATGPKGVTGAQGATGPKGEKGAQGNPGEQGVTGLQGATGPKGKDGIDGNNGEQGATGPKGDTGATGATGPKGDTGATGATGPKGDTGATGATGLQGVRGNRTFYGESETFANTSSETIQVSNPDINFLVGDFYCYTANNNWIVWSCDDIDGTKYTFTNRGTIKGKDGVDGKDGSQGITGAQGIQGVTGPAGRDGVGGDTTYNPSDTTLSTMQLGGIPASTTASSLKGKTVSEMFDMLLFPTYCPIFVDATLTAKLSSNALVEIGGTLPTPSSTVTSAYTQTSAAGANKVFGGSGTAQMTVGSNNSSSTIGTKTWTYKANFAQGTELIKDSKGNNTNQTASNYTTLLGSGVTSYAANIGGTGPAKYVIGSREKTSSASCTVVYPYYAPNAAGAETKQTLTTNTYFIIENYSATNAKTQVFCSVPSSFTGVSITQANVSGQYADPCTVANGKLIVGSTSTKTFGTVSVPYTTYRFKTDDLAGVINYKVEFTKA